MIEISFIVPYYNLEPWLLQRCLKSIIDIEARNIEVIIVDDGTPETKAPEIVSLFNDNRLHYVRRNNGGLSEARNTGLAHAQGEYIQFIDADDYFFPHNYQKLIEILRREKPDIISTQQKKVYGETTERQEHKGEIKMQSFASGIDFLNRRSLFAGVWSITFRRYILGNLRFIPGIYHEDEDFTPRLYSQASLIIVSNLHVYAYYQRPGSIINTLDTQRLLKRYNDLRTVMSRLKGISDNAADPAVKSAFLRRYEQVALSAIYRALHDSPTFDFAMEEIHKLGEMGLWPLPKKRYTRAYSTFRLLTIYRWQLKIMRWLLRIK